MEQRSTYTLRLLLEDLKKDLPAFKVGQVYEVLKSFYPTVTTKRDKKNIVLEGVEMTKPLAVNKKAKELFLKDKSPLCEFYKDFKRGDYIEVIKIENGKAYCINRTLKEDILEKYYAEQYIEIDYEDILNGAIRQVKRNAKKILGGI